MAYDSAELRPWTRRERMTERAQVLILGAVSIAIYVGIGFVIWREVGPIFRP